MARKRLDPIEEPPTASSSEEEQEQEQEEKEETSSDEEEGSSSDEGGPSVLAQTQKSPPPKKPETAAPATGAHESDESESDSESESESDSGSPSPKVKPIATKPMEETLNAKKARSKPFASPVRASASKRPNESEQEPKETKRAKKKAVEDGSGSTAVIEGVKNAREDSKKNLFQRLFSEDDEIALLKGMLDYAAKKGADPCADMNAFYDFVKKSIHTDVTKAQLMDKIRRLKKKYENNAGKGKKGEDRTFSKAHEQKAFELSKKIWGKEGISGKVESSAAKSNGKAKGNSKALAALKAELLSSPEKKKVDVGEPMDLDKKVANSGVGWFNTKFCVSALEEAVVKHGWETAQGEKKAALEEKWRKLQIAELELYLQRNEFFKEQAQLMLEDYKSESK